MTSKAWKSKVAAIGCLICGQVASLHHVREGQGMSQRASDFLCISLCREHHQGPSGWHMLGKQGFYNRYKLDEIAMLAMVIEGVVKDL